MLVLHFIVFCCLLLHTYCRHQCWVILLLKCITLYYPYKEYIMLNIIIFLEYNTCSIFYEMY